MNDMETHFYYILNLKIQILLKMFMKHCIHKSVKYYPIVALYTFVEVNQKQNKVFNFVDKQFSESNILTFGNYEVVICKESYLQR